MTTPGQEAAACNGRVFIAYNDSEDMRDEVSVDQQLLKHKYSGSLSACISIVTDDYETRLYIVRK